MSGLPELELPEEVRDAIVTLSQAPGALQDIERRVAEAGALTADFEGSESWQRFRDDLRRLWRQHDHVVVRRGPLVGDGASLPWITLCLGGTFRSYRQQQIVKLFRMSPWTRELSHTLREGDFHTDLNTEACPPAVTAIQGLTLDPGAPDYGENRVARVEDLVRYLEAEGDEATLSFLHSATVTMVNGRDQHWQGHCLSDGNIRFHPATLKAAEGYERDQLDELVRGLHQAALAVSTPFHLDPGDVLLVSNLRALHYRGECSVRFVRYPTDFEARSIYVLHKPDEPQ